MTAKKKKTWFCFSITAEERSEFELKFKSTTCRSRSEYFRHLMHNWPVTIKHRNSSVDDYLREMLAFRKELTILSEDFNQSLHTLYTTSLPPELQEFRAKCEQDRSALLEKIDAILLYVEKQYRLWSHA